MEWRKQETDGNCPVFGKGACSAIVGDHLYIFGGLDDEDYRNDLHRLHLEDFKWQKLSKIGAPPERSYGGMVSHGECLIVFGGLGKKPHAPSVRGAVTIRDDKFGGEFISEWNNFMHEYNTITGVHVLLFILNLPSSSTFLSSPAVFLEQTAGGRLDAREPGPLLWSDSPSTR